ncbi:MAG: anthranilate phosphoribosyltransferase, partial [bacterium]
GSLGVERALIVHGMEGMDEISASDRTVYAEVNNGEIKEGEFTPESFGIQPVDHDDIRGGGPEENERITRELLNGNGQEAVEDIIAINAGGVIYLAEEASDLQEGIARARESIRSGDARQALEDLVDFTKDVSS